jgi:hypothetical protein
MLVPMRHFFAFGPTHTRLVDMPSANARLFTPLVVLFILAAMMSGHTGLDQGFKTGVVFRRPCSTLEARRWLHFPFALSPSSTMGRR